MQESKTAGKFNLSKFLGKAEKIPQLEGAIDPDTLAAFQGLAKHLPEINASDKTGWLSVRLLLLVLERQ